MRRALGVLPAALALLLSACGDPPGLDPGGPEILTPSASPPESSGSVPTSPPTLTPTSRPTTKPPGPTTTPAAGRPLVLDGIVEAGVEPGCKVLSTEAGQYLLLGGGADVPMGVPLRIKGVLMPGVSTTCQQGTPLRALDVRRR